MHFPGILLGLIATASAINITLYYGEGCSGGGVVCADSRPNTCCSGNGAFTFSSIGFTGISASSWERIRCQGMRSVGCRGFPSTTQISSGDSVCLNGGGYNSASYELVNFLPLKN
jgi:hypothetical protein